MQDVISRQAAIDAIEERFFAGTVADINPSWRKLHNILESLPPVTPIERTGEWIDASEGTFCSECDFKTNEYYNFCPNCGADMRGAE